MPRDDARTLALLRRFGHTATAFQVLAPGMAHWFTNDHCDGHFTATPERHHRAPGEISNQGMVGYIDTGAAWVAAGEPIAAREHTIDVARQFIDHAHALGKRVAFFATEGALAASPRFRRVLIGEQPVWNPVRWSEVLASHRSLREQLRRARAKGVTVRAVSHGDFSFDHALRGLMQRWLATRPMPSMHFLVELEPFVHRGERMLFVAERAGVVVAFLSLAPVSARNGWLFEHVLRDPQAPNGSAELMIDFAMRNLGSKGVTWATLGLAPLAGSVAGWLRFVRTTARPFFNFEGLTSFKRKLGPSSWQPVYLAYPQERSSVLAMVDGLRAFAGGSLLRFGLHTVLRGPPPLLRALQLSLIPWTIALALWPADGWFPSPGVKWAWVTFDVLLLFGLQRLRQRWTRRLSMTLATLVSLDTLLTVVQATIWNMPRVQTALEAFIVLGACTAPALAAAVLWGAVHRRATARLH
jgi:phosphatidylglycerol lysyltransferase